MTDKTTAVTTPQTFQEKMYARIKDNIGDLMSDEELKPLIGSAVQKAFFEERRQRNSSGYGQDKILAPYIVEIIDELMKEEVREHVRTYLKEHPEMIGKAVQESLEKGIYGIMVEQFKQITRDPLIKLANELRQVGVPVNGFY